MVLDNDLQRTLGAEVREIGCRNLNIYNDLQIRLVETPKMWYIYSMRLETETLRIDPKMDSSAILSVGYDVSVNYFHFFSLILRIPSPNFSINTTLRTLVSALFTRP